MRIRHSNLDIRFELEGATLCVPNLVFEEFHRSIPPHSHGNDCYEIHYISRGYGKLIVNDSTYRLTPNTLFVTGPFVEHAQSPVEIDPMNEYCVYLRLEKGGRRGAGEILPALARTPFWIGQDQFGTGTKMEALFRELEDRYTGYAKEAELLLTEIVICLARNCGDESDSSRAIPAGNLSDANSLLIEEAFLRDAGSLSLESLAAELKLSARQTERLMRSYYGMTFREKKEMSRMAEAAELLRGSASSISAIAEKLGYSTPESFAAAFQRHFRKSPRDYRKDR